jgi:hypothetical protein
MRLVEINRIVSDNAFEKLKNTEIYNETKAMYESILHINEMNHSPAIDALGEEYRDTLSDAYDLLTRVKKIYSIEDVTYMKIMQIWEYLNQ